ncbi:3257_t:CDS:2 [Racocetra fulgida]|uniref:3257_t:CDS:1 n=1 Tax=Racocetra fulgida TaxID=60492 RepID=A0A9N9BFP0_9GLOM|nr:3257_t:CDS:2 [Racocetra fulgida]
MAKNSRTNESISLKYTSFGLKKSKEEDNYTEDDMMNAPLLSDNSGNEGISVIDEASNDENLESITTLLVGGAMAISLLTDSLGTVLELTGGFSATALAYILPPACYLKLSSGELWTFNKLPAISCVIFGFLVMVLSTALSIAKIIDGWI